MRRHLACCLALVLLCAPLSAQSPGSDPLPHLLGSKAVQKELGLSPEQAERLAAAPAKVRARFQEDREALDDDLVRFNARSAELVDATDNAMLQAAADLLQPQQLARLGQLRLQQLGVWGLADSRVKTTLKLTDKQSEEVRKIQDQFQHDLIGLPDRVARQAKNDPAEHAKLMESEHAALLRGALDKMTALLDAEQKKKWEEMVGTPPAVKSLQTRNPDDSLTSACTLGRLITCSPLLVKAELKTGDDTIRRLQVLVGEVAARQAEQWNKTQQRAQELSERESALQARMFAAYREMARKELLEPRQWTRVEQIERQMAGLDLLLGSAANELALSAEQKKKVRALRQDLGRTGRELISKGFPDRKQFVRAVQEVTRQGYANLERILNADQRVVWAQIVGQPFDFTAIEEFTPLAAPGTWLMPPEQEAQHRAAQHLRQKEYSQAIEAMEEAIDMTPKEPWGYNNLAYLLATCKEDKVRDGKKAVVLATKALLLQPDEGEFMATLAAAEAENGNWETAVQMVNKAIAKARTVRKPAYEAQLKLYKEKKPYRE